MKCPFRCGVRFDFDYIGKNTAEERTKTDNYIETAQHAVFEECYGGDCPFYDYVKGCIRIEE